MIHEAMAQLVFAQNGGNYLGNIPKLYQQNSECTLSKCLENTDSHFGKKTTERNRGANSEHKQQHANCQHAKLDHHLSRVSVHLFGLQQIDSFHISSNETVLRRQRHQGSF